MARTTVHKDINSIAIETGYGRMGFKLACAGFFLFLLFCISYDHFSKLQNRENFELLRLLILVSTGGTGIPLLAIGLLAMGTVQRITYNKGLNKISYRSTVAFLSGHSVSRTCDNLETIIYDLKMIHYPAVKYGQNPLGCNEIKYSPEQIEAFKRWENAITLWYEDGNNVSLPAMPHSDELEEVLELIADETDAEYKKIFSDDRDDNKMLKEIARKGIYNKARIFERGKAY